jgi:hypothetical protein
MRWTAPSLEDHGISEKWRLAEKYLTAINWELQNKILNLYELSHHDLGKMIELMERETISEGNVNISV